VQDCIERYAALPNVMAWKMTGADDGGYLALVAADAPTFSNERAEGKTLTIKRS